MNVDSGWNFKELVNNLETLKEEYDSYIAFFLSCSNNNVIIDTYVKYVRNKFYSLNLKEWQIDICWEYMNGDKLYGEILKIIRRIDR